MTNFLDVTYLNTIQSKLAFHLSYDVKSSKIYCSEKIRLWIIAKLSHIGMDLIDNQIASTFIFTITVTNSGEKNTTIIQSIFDLLESMKEGIKYQLSVIHPYNLGINFLIENNGIEEEDADLIKNIEKVKGNNDYLMLENALIDKPDE